MALLTSLKYKSRQEGGFHSLARNCPADLPAETPVYRKANDTSIEMGGITYRGEDATPVYRRTGGFYLWGKIWLQLPKEAPLPRQPLSK